MTLFKQVALVVTLGFLLIVITIMVASLNQYGSIVRGQLQTTAQDMATTLGITISNSSFGSDKPAYETLFNAVFDSGYYSSIELVTPDGDLIHKSCRFIAFNRAPGLVANIHGYIDFGNLSLSPASCAAVFLYPQADICGCCG